MLLTPAQKRVYDRRIQLNMEISHLRKRGEYTAAVEVYKQMLKEEIAPDEYTYSQVLNLYALLQRPVSAEAVWEKMIASIEKAAADEDWNISKAPNRIALTCLNAMIHTYSMSSNIPNALRFYEDISSKWGLKPDGQSIGPILWALARKGVRPIISLFYHHFAISSPHFLYSEQKLFETSFHHLPPFSPNRFEFLFLIPLEFVYKIELIYILFALLRVPLNFVVSLTFLMLTFLLFSIFVWFLKDVPAVERLLFDFKQRYPDWVPDIQLYTLLIGMYGKAGQFHHISKLLGEMKQNKVDLDVLSVRMILKTLMSADASVTSELVLKLADLSALGSSFFVLAEDLTTMSEAYTLLASMNASDNRPDVSIFNMLLHRACKTYTEAKEFIRMMEEEYQLKPNAHTYYYLLMIAATPAHRSKLEDVAEISKKMNDSGLLPLEGTLCILIRFYSQIGDKKTAEAILQILKAQNPIISPQTHNAVVRMYAFGGPHDKLMAALKDVQAAKIKLPSSTVDILFQSMMRRGKYADCAQVLTHMIYHREQVQMRHIISLFANLLARTGRTDVTAEFYNFRTNPHLEDDNTTTATTKYVFFPFFPIFPIFPFLFLYLFSTF